MTTLEYSAERQRKTDEILKKAILIFMGAAFLIGMWLFFTGQSDFQSKRECLSFAEKHKDWLFSDYQTIKLTAGDTWRKNGKTVVEIRGWRTDENFRTRLCVVGHDSVELPSMFEELFWQWR
jgi:hypothetical protein